LDGCDIGLLRIVSHSLCSFLSGDESPVNSQREPDNRLVCPNCQALNTPNTVICAGCGVDMDAFRASMPRLQRIKREEAQSHREQLKGEMGSWLQEEKKISRASFMRLMLGLFVVVMIIGLVVSLGSFLYASQYRKSQDDIRNQFDASKLCLQQKNYICARDGFQSLKNAGIANLDDYINQAQLGIAQQYLDSGQSEKAVSELRNLLERDPGNQPAIDLLKLAYGRWIKQLDTEGNWVREWFVANERDARFPPVVPTIPYPNGTYP
jgi:hypothetical protein